MSSMRHSALESKLANYTTSETLDRVIPLALGLCVDQGPGHMYEQQIKFKPDSL